MIRREKILWSHGLFGPWLAALVAWVLVAAPAFAQTLRSETVASGLEHPWSVAFLPGGHFLVTERPGRMRIVAPGGGIGAPIAGVPAVAASGQGGLHDVILDSGFSSNRELFFCYAESGEGGSGTAVARARLSADETRLENLKVIFRQKPKTTGNLQYGCRIVEAPDGHLFVALGDRFKPREKAQSLDNDLGKILRITKDGAHAAGNPFVENPDALPEIWTYGHRNPQGLTLAPDLSLWETEHGPQGGDEVNLIRPGLNYGWPVVTYGEEYGGGKIGEGITHKEGMEQPLHHWTPSIAPSGMAFVTSDRYGPAMKGNLFVGSLKFRYLARLELAQGKVARESRALDVGERVRDVRQGPDGFLYLLTDETDGRLIRVLPS
ncbi:MAG TPA: PQQ-dependent sugar dehydrogenase [Ramlibacter sp.]|nr:PQQ-dependent sugar dehydrogenase [Ramlibacter sp.]